MAEPLSFADLVDWHEQAKRTDPFFGTLSLPQFSERVNIQAGANIAQAGAKDNLVMRASSALDRLLRPVSRDTAALGRQAVSKVFGEQYGDVGARVGRDLPRSAIELLGVFSGIPPVQAVAVASAGAKGYTETGGSPIAGLISAGTTATMPGVARLGQKLISRPLVEKLVDSGLSLPVRSTLQRGAESLGPNVTIAAQGELAAQATSLAVSGQPFNPLTKEHLIEQAAGQLPFAVFDAARLLNFRRPSATEIEVVAKRTADSINQETKNEIKRYHDTAATAKPPAPVASDAVGKPQINAAAPAKVPKSPLADTQFVDVGKGVKLRADLLWPYDRWLKEASTPRKAKIPWTTEEIMRVGRASKEDAQMIFDIGIQRGLISPEGNPLRLAAGESDLLDNLVATRKPADAQMGLFATSTLPSVTTHPEYPSLLTRRQEILDRLVEVPESAVVQQELNAINLRIRNLSADAPTFGVMGDTGVPVVFGEHNFYGRGPEMRRLVRAIEELTPEAALRGAHLQPIEAPVKPAEGGKMPEGVPPVTDERPWQNPLNMSDPTKWDIGLLQEIEQALPQITPDLTQGISTKDASFQAAQKMRRLITGDRRVSDLIAALDDPIVQAAMVPVLRTRGYDAIEVPFGRTYVPREAGELATRSLGVEPVRLAPDQLLQQLTEVYGKDAPQRILGRGPVDSMVQLESLYHRMASLASSALEGHPIKPLETWMKGVEGFTNELLRKGLAPEVVAERVYQKMMTEVREQMIPQIEQAQQRVIEDQLKKVRDFLKKVPEADRPRVLREIYSTGRAALLAKLGRLHELERPLPNGVSLLDELVNFVKAPARPDLGQVAGQTRPWLKALEERFGPAVDPMGRLYASAVDFMDTHAERVRAYRARSGMEAKIEQRGWSDADVTKEAFRDYIHRAAQFAASEQYKETLAIMTGLAERMGIDPSFLKRTTPEEGDVKQHRLLIVSEEQLSGDADAKATNLALADFIQKNVPTGLTPELWNAAHLGAGLAKPKRRLETQLRNRYEKLLQMVHDGVFGFRKPKFSEGTKALGDVEVFVRQESGMRVEDVAKLLDFENPLSAANFVRDSFFPTLKQLIKFARETPDRVLVYGREKTSASRAPDFFDELVSAPPAAKEALLQGRNAETFALAARTYFQEHFSHLGYAPEHIGTVVDLATKMALSFQAVSYASILPMGGEQALGLSHIKRLDDRLQGIVGVNFDLIRAKADKAMAPFFALWTLGHEMSHQIMHAVELSLPGEFLPGVKMESARQFRAWAGELPPDMRSNIIGSLFDLVVPKGKFDPEIRAHRMEEAVRSTDEFVADFISLHSLGHLSPAKNEVGARLAVTADYNVQFLRGLYTNLFEISEAVLGFVREGHERWLLKNDLFDAIYATEEAPLLEHLPEMQSHVKNLLADLKQVEDSFSFLQRIEQMDPSRYAEMVAMSVTPEMRKLETIRWWDDKVAAAQSSNPDTLQKLQSAMGLRNHSELEKAYGLVPRTIHKWFFPMAQLASRFPVLWPAARVVYNFRPDVNSLVEGFLTPFMTRTISGRMALDIKHSGLATALKDPSVNKAVTWMALRKNEVMDRNPASGGVLSEAQMDKMLAGRFPGMSEGHRQTVIDMHKKLEFIMPAVAAEYVKRQRSSVKNHVGMAIQLMNKGLSPSQILAIVDPLVDSVYKAGDPNQTQGALLRKQLGLQELQQLRTMLDPDVFATAVKSAEDLIGTVYQLEEHFGTDVGGIPGTFEGRNGANPRTGFTPEVRKGRHIVTWADVNDQTGARAFDDIGLANEFARDMKAQGAHVRQHDLQDKASMLEGMGPKLVQAFARREQEAFRAFTEKVRAQHGDDIAELLGGYEVGQLVMKDVAGRSVGKYKLPRGLKAGREDINTMENVIDYVFASATALAKREAKERMALHLNDPSLVGNPKLRRLARDHMLTVLDPPTKELSAFKNANFLMYMAGNVSTMLVELSQSLVSLAPTLTEQVVNGQQTGVLNSYKYIGRAVGEFVDLMLHRGKFRDTDIERAITNARKRGILDFGVMQEFHPDMDSAFLNLRNLVTGANKRWEGYELFTKPLTWVLHTTRWLYSQFPKFNTHLAYISAYRLGKDRGLSGHEAEAFAEQIVLTSNFGGGPAGRPVDLFARSGKFHGAVGAVYSLQTYMFGMTAMLARMGEVSIGNAKGFTPAQKSAARRAFAQALGTQLAAAGALGLPLADSLVSLVEQFFPVELRKWLREVAAGVGTWATQDEEMGSAFGDMAMRGVANKMFEAASVPIDVGSRLSLSQGMGLDPYSGFQVKNVLGPIGGVFENAARGITKMAEGEVGEGTELMVPRSVQKALRLYNDQGTFRDASGRPIYEPDALEQTAYVLGFQPQRLREHQEQAQLTRQHEKVQAGKMQRFHHRVADLVEKGQLDEARQLLVQMEKDYPDSYSAVAGARNVATIVRERRTPIDLVDEGTRMGAGGRAAIQQLVGQRTVTSEVDRLLMQKRIEADLGIPRSALMSPTELRMATMIDRLVQANPMLSHQMARAIVERGVRVPRPGLSQ